MESTPLHHKPVAYGSDLADLLFLVVVVLHVLPAFAAPVSGIVALATRKGSKLHQRAGRVFAWSMGIVAVTGIALIGVRLAVAYEANHTKYLGFGQPSTIPARLGFLYAGLGVLYLLWESVPRRGRESRWLVVGGLLAVGAGLTAIVFARYNPWTGALWMIWTFMLLVVLVARSKAKHRAGMTLLAAFSWWGAAQGFIPGVVLALRGPDTSTKPYTGDQPGPFTPFFFMFLIAFSIAFVIAALLIRRFSARRRPANAQAE